MSCQEPKPIYLSHAKEGINAVVTKGDGYTIDISWTQAFPDQLPYRVLYNIYFSTLAKDVFTEGVKNVSIDSNILVASITDLTPGDTYFFAVRATEIDPSWSDPNLLPTAPNGLKFYPETLLLEPITETSIAIKIADIHDFPPTGVVLLGTELIRYTAIDAGSQSLITSLANRGFLNTDIRSHAVDGYDGYVVQDPVLRFWKAFEEQNTTVYQGTSLFAYPNFPFTAKDGYRDQKDIINTDLSADENLQINFQPYDYVGWHRTDPEQLFNGDCIGTYYGGEQFCADGYDVGFQLRGVPFNQVNDQRQEVLLDLEGDPCCLLRRRTTGVTCSCYESLTQNPAFRCPNCFLPGTLVRTISGYKPIENISIGEKVLTHDGTYQIVKEVMERNYHGEIISILPSISTVPIKVTPEHPFLIMRGSHQATNARPCGPKCNNFIRSGNGHNYPLDIRQLPSGKYHARITLEGKRKILGSFDIFDEAKLAIFNFKKENFIKGHFLTWDSAETIKEDNWLHTTVPQNVEDIDVISIPEKILLSLSSVSRKNGEESFKVDEEFLWMVGLYLAEGSSGKRAINFALHRKETDFQTRIINYFKNRGYNPKLRFRSGNGVCVEIASTKLSMWFPQWLGKKCYNKQIPEELMCLPLDKIKFLIQGIYDGDSSKTHHNIGITSQIMSLQIAECLHRMGEQPLIRRQISKKLTPKGNVRKICYVVNWAEDTIDHHNRRGRWDFSDEKYGRNILSKVRKIEKEQYCGLVYNLEVENNHTYVVEGITTHNCYNVGIVLGYEQYFFPRRSDGRIMVKFNPADEDIKIEDEGLENSFFPNCWTLTVPALKSRDVLVRFNEDGTEEFRYKILKVTRNRLLSSISGAQKFDAVRVRKTDPVYQFPVFRDTSMFPSEITTSIGFIQGPGGLIPHTHQIKISEKITDISQISEATSVSLGHSHEVRGNVVVPRLGHTHTISL